MKAHGSIARRDIAAEVTAKILCELERGIMPWRKPWDSARTNPTLPRRAQGEPYRGANVIMLWSAAVANGYASPYWLTLKQANHLGASVRRGEHGETVIYYGAAKARKDAGENKKTESSFRFLKFYTAFNAEQIDGLPDAYYPQPGATLDAIPHHEDWFSQLDIARILTRNVACYIPSKDAIGMPPLAAFDSAEAYAATLNHECVHATMAEHRVNRDMGSRFSSQARAAEELVAEIGASILGAHLHLPPSHIEDHAAYIGHWLAILRDDKRAFLFSAARAQAAVDWLIEKSPAPESYVTCGAPNRTSIAKRSDLAVSPSAPSAS